MSTKPHVVDVTERTFQSVALEASLQHPVIIDFWAEWCEPCKQMAPALEALAEAGQGQWLLAKVDVDNEGRLAQYFQIQSIPFVVAIYQGQIVDQFSGQRPKAELERWLESVFKACGLELKKAAPTEAPKDPAQAEAFYRHTLSQKPDDSAAKLALGRLLLARGASEDALSLLAEIPGSAPEFSQAQAALALKELMKEIGEAGGEAAIRERMQSDAANPETAYLVALLAGTSGHIAVAISGLVDLIGARAQADTPQALIKPKARKAASMLLEAAGRGDADVEVQRKRLTRLLF